LPFAWLGAVLSCQSFLIFVLWATWSLDGFRDTVQCFSDLERYRPR
jgi:hypothetical protein